MRYTSSPRLAGICMIILLALCGTPGIQVAAAAGSESGTVTMTRGPVSFTYPGSWNFTFNETGQSYKTSIPGTGSYVAITYVNQTGDFYSYVLDQKEVLNTSFSAMTEEKFTEGNISGHPAYHRIFSADSFSGKRFVEEIWYLDTTDLHIVAQYLAYPDEYDLNTGKFNALVRTIKPVSAG